MPVSGASNCRFVYGVLRIGEAGLPAEMLVPQRLLQLGLRGFFRGFPLEQRREESADVFGEVAEEAFAAAALGGGWFAVLEQAVCPNAHRLDVGG